MTMNAAPVSALKTPTDSLSTFSASKAVDWIGRKATWVKDASVAFASKIYHFAAQFFSKAHGVVLANQNILSYVGAFAGIATVVALVGVALYKAFGNPTPAS